MRELLDGLLFGIGTGVGWTLMQIILVILSFLVVYFIAKSDEDDE